MYEVQPDSPAAAAGIPGAQQYVYVGNTEVGVGGDLVLAIDGVKVDRPDAINRAMSSPDVAEKMAAGGLTVVTGPPEYFGEVMRNDYARFGKLVREIGFQPQ